MDEVLRFLGVRIWIADILYSWDLFEVLCTPNRRPSSSKERTAIPQDPFKVRLAAFVRKVVAEVDDAKKANNTVQGLFRTNPVNWGLNSNSQSAQQKLNIIGKSWHGMAWVDLTGLTQKSDSRLPGPTGMPHLHKSYLDTRSTGVAGHVNILRGITGETTHPYCLILKKSLGSPKEEVKFVSAVNWV